MPDVTYELLQGKQKKKTKREKEMLGWAFPASPAQVSIRLVFDFSLKVQPPQPGHTPGCSASTQPPPSSPSSQQGLQFSVKSLLAKPGSCQHLPVYLWSRRGQEEECRRGGGQPLFGVTHSFTQKTPGKAGRTAG